MLLTCNLWRDLEPVMWMGLSEWVDLSEWMRMVSISGRDTWWLTKPQTSWLSASKLLPPGGKNGSTDLSETLASSETGGIDRVSPINSLSPVCTRWYYFPSITFFPRARMFPSHSRSAPRGYLRVGQMFLLLSTKYLPVGTEPHGSC